MTPASRHTLGLVASLALAACAKTPAAPAVIARVGAREVTEAALALRQRQIDLAYPDAGTREAALGQLVQGYLAAEVLAAHGVALDQAALEAEGRRVDAHTRDPARLAQLKALYAAAPQAYLEVGLLPDFARSRLDRVLSGTAETAEAARVAASAFLDRVEMTPERFAAEARAAGLAVRTLTLGRGGLTERGEAVADPEAARRLEALLGELAQGRVHPNTVESPEGFSVVRLRERVAGRLELELVTFPRGDPAAAFWREARRVPVWVGDPRLRASFLAAVPWATQLGLQREAGAP